MTYWDAPGLSQEAPGASPRAPLAGKTPPRRCQGWNVFSRDSLRPRMACRCWARPGSPFCRYHQPPASAQEPLRESEYPQSEAAPQEPPVRGDERVRGREAEGEQGCR